MSVVSPPNAGMAPRDLDADLRRASSLLYAVGYVVGLLIAGAVDLASPWPPLGRLILPLSLPAVGACWLMVRRLPWRRAPHPLYATAHGANLALIALALAVSGGWANPFAVVVPLAVAFAALTGVARQAVPVAVLGCLVTVSPALYTRGGYPVAVGLTALPVYLGLVYLIQLLLRHVYERDRAVSAATRAQEQVERLVAELRVRAERDPLTGLLNHRALMEALDDALAAGPVAGAGAACAILMIDVDRFKTFNDAHGHLEGDAVLRAIAAILQEGVRHGDLPGRCGGDEFLAILPGADRADAAAVAARLVGAVRERPYVTADGTTIPLSISVGVAAAPRDATTRRGLLAAADAAMYATKRSARSAC